MSETIDKLTTLVDQKRESLVGAERAFNTAIASLLAHRIAEVMPAAASYTISMPYYESVPEIGGVYNTEIQRIELEYQVQSALNSIAGEFTISVNKTFPDLEISIGDFVQE